MRQGAARRPERLAGRQAPECRAPSAAPSSHRRSRHAIRQAAQAPELFEPAQEADFSAGGDVSSRSLEPIPGEGENYIATDESPVKQVAEADGLSTFSIDVDTGAYSNVRRFLMNGQLPPKDAVRVEEMINYFAYDYPAPEAGGEPFRVTTAVERTPWNNETYLLHVGIKGYEPPAAERPAANLVFLVDVSGSMDQPDKLPLLKAGMKMLTDQLRDDDKVTIVVYAGAAGLVLEPTAGKDKAKIRTRARPAARPAGRPRAARACSSPTPWPRRRKIDGGINRVILATDGDFNVGVTDIEQLKDDDRGCAQERRRP